MIKSEKVKAIISLPKEMHDKAKRIAKENAMSFSYLVRRGLQLAIRELEKEAEKDYDNEQQG